MKVQQPFKRFRKMLAQIQQAKLLKGVEQMLALDQIGEYHSRGKGHGMHYAVRTGVRAMKRLAGKRRNQRRHKSLCNGNGNGKGNQR